MPRMTYSVTGAGLAVPVWVGMDGKTTAARFAAGRPVAAPLRLRGLLDTCSDITAVAPWVFQQLAIPPASGATTHTAAGPVAVRLFEVSLSIDDPGQSGQFLLTQSDIAVLELSAALPDADVLLPRHESSSCGTALLSRPDGSGEPSHLTIFLAAVIIGLDVLLRGEMLLQGPTRQFTLDF